MNDKPFTVYFMTKLYFWKQCYPFFFCSIFFISRAITLHYKTHIMSHKDLCARGIVPLRISAPEDLCP